MVVVGRPHAGENEKPDETIVKAALDWGPEVKGGRRHGSERWRTKSGDTERPGMSWRPSAGTDMAGGSSNRPYAPTTAFTEQSSSQFLEDQYLT